jgi:uncharacterized membrane protein YfcA
MKRRPGAAKGHIRMGGLMEPVTVYVLAVVFLASLIRSAFGFGEALFAVPLLALRLPLPIAAPVAVLLSITIAGFVVAQDWRMIHLRRAGWLMFATLFGIPLGLEQLASSHQKAARSALGLLVVAFASYALLGRKPPELRRDQLGWLLGCGLAAGVLGGAYGINGPPLVIYGAMRRWTAQHFRATLQGYFLPASPLGMAGYWAKGLWAPAVTHYYLISLPAVVPAILLGRVLNHRMEGAGFLRYVYAGLACVGGVLVGEALLG